MKNLRFALAALAPLVLAANASAQAFNLDVGDNLILWPEPSAAYGAGAGQTGFWNPVITPFSMALTDVSGTLTAVNVTSDITSSFNYPFSGLTGDDDAFCSDAQHIGDIGPAATWVFSGLVNGEYDIFTYAWAPENSGAQTNVTVPALPGSTQTVGGSWSGSPHVLGVTYARHHVTVTDGTITVEVEGVSGNSGTLNGFQIVPAQIFTPFCFGDGTGTGCPCGNFSSAGRGCSNSTGQGALLTAGGTNSATLDDLTLLITELPPSTPGLLFSGTTQLNGGNGQVFGDGLRCAGGGIKRLGVRIASGSGVATWGPGLASGAGWVSGDTRTFQLWYRDTSGSPCGGNFNLTNGVQVVYGP